MNTRLLIIAIAGALFFVVLLLLTDTSDSFEFGRYKSAYGISFHIPDGWKDISEQVKTASSSG